MWEIEVLEKGLDDNLKFKFIEIPESIDIDVEKVSDDKLNTIKFNNFSTDLNRSLQLIHVLIPYVDRFDVKTLTELRFGYINYIEAYIERINKKLRLTLDGPTFLQNLMNLLTKFIENVGFVFPNEHLGKILEIIGKITKKKDYGKEETPESNTVVKANATRKVEKTKANITQRRFRGI